MIRDSVAAGILYPDQPEHLRTTVQRLLHDAVVDRSNANAIVSPNGAWDATGPFVGAAFKAAALADPELIVILAPPNDAIGAHVLLPESDTFSTPIGAVPVETRVVADLASSSTNFIYDEIAHLRDDGIEVQLPFTAYLFPGVPIVPLFVGEISDGLVRLLGSTIELSAARRRTLFVASSNISALGVPVISEYQSRTIFRWIMTPEVSDYTEIRTEMERPLRSIGTLATVKYHCRRHGIPTLLTRGTNAFDEEGIQLRVEYAAFAYYPPENEG